jgi:hypothetical protein
MQRVTIYNTNGEHLNDYRDITVVSTEGGVLKFKWERNPGERATMETVITNLPFVLIDDMN